MLKIVYPSICIFFLVSSVISAAEARLELPGRKAFVRNEKKAFLKVAVMAVKGDLSGLELSGTIAGFPVQMQEMGQLASGKKELFLVPVETRLSVGKYPIDLTLKSEGQEKPARISAQLLIGPELHDRMMVLCSLYYPFHHKAIQEVGFTHASQNYWRSPEYCDEMLFDGFRAVERYPFLSRKELKNLPWQRLMRNGNPYPVVNVSHPKVKETAQRLAKARGEKLADYPAIEAVDINNEFRDHTKVSFDPVSKEAFHKFSGYPIPQEADAKDGIHYSSIRNFPLSRIVPDNDRILTFYKWFWKDGDGYNVLNNIMLKSYRDGLKRPVWSLYAPAMRVPPIWGSGGKVNYLYHWTYATPDPINAGVNISELQAMAGNRPGIKLMSGTQIIVYRSAVAPIGMKPANEPAWAKEFPKAPYITLAPDMMSIAIWSLISRKADAAVFHGLDSLLQNPRKKNKDVGYQCTNHQTAVVFKEIMDKVVKPLGPVLKRVPERKSEVAVLESFASAIFAQRATWGWVGWQFDVNLSMLWGNLAPQVIYDETILRDGFEGIKVLLLPCCDVLTEKVYKAIADFQRKGGIVVGDRYLVPCLTPEITIRDYRRTGDAPKDKAALQKIGIDLRDKLAPYYQPYVRTSDPDIVTWVRSSGKADYLFAVNDKRTFGDYFGPYKKVMEKSVDNAGTITVRRADTAVIYDPVNHCEVPFEIKNGMTVIQTAFDGKSIGKLFLLLPEKIGRIELKLPSSAEKGETIQLRVSLETISGKPVESIHPIQIEVRDAEGKSTCDSTSAALENGVYSQSLTIPLNAAAGPWKIKAVDLASGKYIERDIMVR